MDISPEADKQEEENQTVEPAVLTEAAQPAENSGGSKKPLKRLPGKQAKQRLASRPSRRDQLTLQQVTERFAACGRCSYFWTGYRILFGEDALETAVAQSQSGWLNLQWNWQMPELIHKSYAARLDITHFHYEGSCKECRRTFVYQAAESEDETDSFRIEISPRTAK